MDAALDIGASYGLRTNSAGLLANDGVEGSRYNQRLDYFVVLQIQGFLRKPSLMFLIDLKEEYKRSYSIVADKLTQLNLPQNDAERNQQVFALLVTGSFISDGPTSSSSDNFATTAARNSVNGILTQQLNNITDQYINFVDFNVGVNTYENRYAGTSETRTDLDIQVSKKLANDRLSVEVESSINLDGEDSNGSVTPGNTTSFEYAVLYELTESGNYRVKLFRENAYDLFDGEIQNSGIAFIFIRDFDPGAPKEKKQKKGINKEQQKPEETEKQEENE
jgi:hypothetical protein